MKDVKFLSDQTAMQFLPVHLPLLEWFTIYKESLYSRDDEKLEHRERYSGPTLDFKEEEEGYRPDVKLYYTDDDGHVLNARRLSDTCLINFMETDLAEIKQRNE
ncbi:hypothetical protein B7P43_G10179 [Cryptotermes secundus]|uniref:Uncharacterized protein n=1 Tax=Cryptotermes secundus TaxID=105785 RepID=A0A2J7QEV6_9NEOP|nr:hypothetical protein B7P43_G10179 [Cryptotermes secundus]